MENKKFALKELRQKKNFTQQAVANDLGIHVNTYLEWEKSLANVGLAKAKAIAEYFKVDVNDIEL